MVAQREASRRADKKISSFAILILKPWKPRLQLAPTTTREANPQMDGSRQPAGQWSTHRGDSFPNAPKLYVLACVATRARRTFRGKSSPRSVGQSLKGSVAKNWVLRKCAMRGSGPALDSRRQAEDTVDVLILDPHITLSQPSHLPFPNLVDRLVTLESSPAQSKRQKCCLAQIRFLIAR